MAFGIFAAVLVVLYAISKYGTARARKRSWDNRLKRLCVSCNSIEQPLLNGQKQWYCPVCDALNPIPIDSPAAKDYFGRKSETQANRVP